MSIRRALLGACAFAMTTAACDDAFRRDFEMTDAALTLAPSTWLVDFSNPGTSAATAVDTMIDERVIDAMDQATTSIDIAVYGFDHPGITSAVLRARARGVAVRFVGHGDELATATGMKAIQTAGVPMVLRPGSALMHHKFVIVDRHMVGFGSFNFTTYAADQNDENFVWAESTELATIFQGEFDQMFAGKFGAKKTARATRPTVPVDGGSVTLAFSPKEQTSTRLREALASAQTRVYFMTYSFTLADVANDLVALASRGVEVFGVFDKSSASSRYSQDDFLAANGVRVSLDGNENASGFAGGRLHDKVMIVDAGGSDPLVVTGSYNWSAGATDDNDETLAILRGQRFVAPYVAEFCRVYRNSSAATQQVELPSLCQDRPLVALTEVMANPDGTDRYEEYVEITNVGNAAADLSGWSLADAVATRHVFPAGATLAPHASIVIWSGAGQGRTVASTGQLALNNDLETVTLINAQGAPADQVTLGVALSGDAVHRSNAGLTDLDFDGVLDGGAWGQHSALSGNGTKSSPGLRVDGTSWAPIQDPGQGGGDPGQGPGNNDVDDVNVKNALPNPVGSDRPEEYVVIVNGGAVAVDLSGWALGDVSNPHRHVFAPGSVLAVGQSLKIYDGGTHADGIAASSGALSLNNDSETVTLYDASGAVVSTLSWANAAEGQVVGAP